MWTLYMDFCKAVISLLNKWVNQSKPKHGFIIAMLAIIFYTIIGTFNGYSILVTSCSVFIIL